MKRDKRAIHKCHTWFVGVLVALVFGLMSGCTTREIMGNDWTRETYGQDEFQVHATIVRAGAALDWDMGVDELRSVRLYEKKQQAVRERRQQIQTGNEIRRVRKGSPLGGLMVARTLTESQRSQDSGTTLYDGRESLSCQGGNAA